MQLTKSLAILKTLLAKLRISFKILIIKKNK